MGESTLDWRVLTDRSIVEVFAMGGRGSTTTHDYPAEGAKLGFATLCAHCVALNYLFEVCGVTIMCMAGSAMFHLVNWGDKPLIVTNLSIASMACGWAPAPPQPIDL